VSFRNNTFYDDILEKELDEIEADSCSFSPISPQFSEVSSRSKFKQGRRNPISKFLNSL